MENREYKKVIEYVKSEILKGSLHLDDKLPTERILAENLGMSRNSIREALRTMENMGILECTQGSGNYLTGNLNKMFTESIGMMLLLKQVSYREINAVRRALEADTYVLAMHNMTEEMKERLKELYQGMKTSQGNEEIFNDKEFHYLLIRASGNKLIISIMEAIEEIYEESIGHILKNCSKETKNKLMLCHKKMLECIINKDEINGRIALNEHYDIIEKQY
ncbi:MAG: FadR/GntR family transcriptional regulator [Aminipila sp.]